MKKVLVYTVTAVLLGIVTMLAPLGLFVGQMNQKAGWYPEEARPRFVPVSVPETLSEETDRKFGVIEAAQLSYPLDISFIVFMLVFSLIMALSITLYLRRRTLGSSLP